MNPDFQKQEAKHNMSAGRLWPWPTSLPGILPNSHPSSDQRPEGPLFQALGNLAVNEPDDFLGLSTFLHGGWGCLAGTMLLKHQDVWESPGTHTQRQISDSGGLG